MLNDNNINIARLFIIAEHGKLRWTMVGDVGGVAKTTIRRESEKLFFLKMLVKLSYSRSFQPI